MTVSVKITYRDGETITQNFASPESARRFLAAIRKNPDVESAVRIGG